MNQNGDITVEIPITMDQQHIFIMEKQVHTLLSKKMFNWVLLSIMKMNGDITVEIHITMDLSHISISEKLVHTLL